MLLYLVVEKIYQLILEQLKEMDSTKYQQFDTLSAVLSSKIWQKSEMVSAIVAITDDMDEVEAGNLWDCLWIARKTKCGNAYVSYENIGKDEVLNALDIYVSLWSKFGKKPKNPILLQNALINLPTVFHQSLRVLVDKYRIYGDVDGKD
mmetsp:Transcript_22710/g.31132  ORF Transcript_22710/g.31132 Transcript_22710/m.31132 type:complete len:149 (-) Transcript_22710:503-949(-)